VNNWHDEVGVGRLESCHLRPKMFLDSEQCANASALTILRLPIFPGQELLPILTDIMSRTEDKIRLEYLLLEEIKERLSFPVTHT
jgi:hypothetical protein